MKRQLADASMERDINKRPLAFSAGNMGETTDSNHDGCISPNQLDRQFNPKEMDTALVNVIA